MKIIEDLNATLSNQINTLIKIQQTDKKLLDYIYPFDEKNKSELINNVLSISNKQGFIKQSDQFEDREVASLDKSSYKIVKKDVFAYNPARINVGSIAKYDANSIGIISPMYVCFVCNNNLLSDYLNYFYKTTYFKHEMHKRLEGSVRLCLTFNGMTNIPFICPSIENQKQIIQKLNALSQKISIERMSLELYRKFKNYLLSKLFI